VTIASAAASLALNRAKGTAMLEVNHLYHDYEGSHYAVQDVSFNIDRGEIFGFLGPSGAGNSTVQNILTGLLPLQRGDVRYDGVIIRLTNAGNACRLWPTRSTAK
jgi:ABC-type multidrug transport system ATPase subunit